MADGAEAPAVPAGMLAGCPILIVEDEYIIAREMNAILTAWGAAVVGPAPTVTEALGLMAAHPQLACAVLDINLRGELVYSLADALLERRIPVIFVTGYGAGSIPPAYAAMPRCEKPVDVAALGEAIRRLVRAA